MKVSARERALKERARQLIEILLQAIPPDYHPDEQVAKMLKEFGADGEPTSGFAHPDEMSPRQ